jgi:hypothetical protein
MHPKGKRGYCTIPMLTMHCGHLKASYSHPSLANLARLKRPLIIGKSSSASRASQAHLGMLILGVPIFTYISTQVLVSLVIFQSSFILAKAFYFIAWPLRTLLGLACITFTSHHLNCKPKKIQLLLIIAYRNANDEYMKAEVT